MEEYRDFLDRIAVFEVAELDLGKSYFRGKASLADKIDSEGRLKPFFGDTVVFDLDLELKNRLKIMTDGLYSAAGDCLAERLPASTMHMTLHDFSNGANLDLLRGKMAENEEKIRELSLPQTTIKMRSSFVFNMVNTSLVLGLVPADEGEHKKLMALYEIFDGILAAKYPLTPHITLAYFTPNGFGEEEKTRLETAVNEINKASQFEIILDTKRLFYQHFFSMNDYRNIIKLA